MDQATIQYRSVGVMFTVMLIVGAMLLGTGCSEMPGACGIYRQHSVTAVVAEHNLLPASANDDHLWDGSVIMEYVDHGLNQSCWLDLTTNNPSVNDVKEIMNHYNYGDTLELYTISFDDDWCYFQSDLNKQYKHGLDSVIIGTVYITFALCMLHTYVIPADQMSIQQKLVRIGNTNACFAIAMVLALLGMVFIGMPISACKLMPGHCGGYSTSSEHALVLNHVIDKQACPQTQLSYSDCWKGSLNMTYADRDTGDNQTCIMTVLERNVLLSNVQYALVSYPEGSYQDVVRVNGEDDVCYLRSHLNKDIAEASALFVVVGLFGAVFFLLPAVAIAYAILKRVYDSAYQAVPTTEEEEQYGPLIASAEQP